ncbi:MAG: L,D-transpeptidase family protein [Planctomycetaceae bacterium]|nr:L,D-transpeptidase family protein [Planctomycetaceae bacterium]
MAVSGYGNNKSKVFVYYVVIGLVIIAAAIFIFYPHKKNKQQDETPVTLPPEQQTQPAQTQPVQPSQNTVAPGTPITPPANSTNPRAAAMLADAQNCINAGKVITARNTLNDVLNMQLDSSTRDIVKRQMTELANQWLFTRVIQLGDDLCTSYRVQAGDRLTDIAAAHKIPYQLIMRINNITSDRGLRSGQTIKVINGPFHAVAYKSGYILDLYLQNIYVKSYKIGIGKEGHETPAGLWRVKLGGKMIKPTWTDPESGRIYHAEDPDYPLGSGWIALDGIDNRTRGINGIAIHGTKDENTIGTKSSLGCIRLYNGELTEVYDMMEPGASEVRIVE